MIGVQTISPRREVTSRSLSERSRGWSAAALNFRSCSGELNRLPRSVHSGETSDLAFVVERLLQERSGAPLLIAGVSLGGNVLVKWLGEIGASVPRELRAAAAISTPFDLSLCASALDGPGFWARIYRGRFLRTLLAKTRAKAARFPRALDVNALDRIHTLTEFDERVAAPLHGFSGAAGYYARSSSGPFLARPTRSRSAGRTRRLRFVFDRACPLVGRGEGGLFSRAARADLRRRVLKKRAGTRRYPL